MKKSKKSLIAGITAIVVIAVGVTAYIQGKQYITRKEVKAHLAEEGHSESEIVELDSFIANLSGDKNWMAVVELQGDEGHYYYYYDRAKEKVVLESYTLDGEEYDSPAETAKGK